jgi:hypothetical protein
MPEQKKTRNFKILYPHRFTDGHSVPRSNFYPTSNPVLIDHLIKSQGAQELAEGSIAPVAAPPTQVEAAQAAAEKARIEAINGEAGGGEEKEEKPDFTRRTKSDLRQFLDLCGRPQPGSSAKHSTLATECEATWASGIRPSPFYGLPGGPVPSEGMRGPDAGDADLIEEAIAFAEEHELEVPEEARAAVLSLRAAAKEAAEAAAEAASAEASSEEPAAETTEEPKGEAEEAADEGESEDAGAQTPEE